MVLLGMEVYRISEVPIEVRAQFPNANPNSLVIKKIEKNSPIEVKWEIYNGKFSEWLLEGIPEED